MSKTVDERVVEMRFDNRHFESNVNTTMSTLEKLKSKLNLSGASKGLSNLSSAAKKVDLSSVGNAVQTVHSKFSALEVMGVTALANITNSAVNAGKRIASALTIEPIKTGFSEYETKINAIQTILANTSSKGEDINSVTKVIDELNTYADDTIYNFAEMTRNIGTFTAAGVGLRDSADAIKGIANLAAMSGSNSQQASTAMYQLSQALAAGSVKLMDWNSVVNAGMGGEKFQEALKATAREFGIDVDSMIKKAGSFRESLKDGWITADVLNTTLKKFTIDGAKEYGEAMVKSGKWTKEQADALLKEAEMAEEAATSVKTLTQLWSTLKETAQSGWGKTWELIFGDFEEAKLFFTDLNNIFGPMIDNMSDARNALIDSALSSKWGDFTAKIEEAGVSVDTFKTKLAEVAKEKKFNLDGLIKDYGSLEAAISKGKVPADLLIETLKQLAGVSETTKTATGDLNGKLEEFQKIVDRVWRGDFGNGADRVKALSDAGYDYAKIQSLVNKSVDGYRLTLEDLSDEQLKAIGYTEAEVTQLRALAEQADKTGTPINDLIKSLEKPSGRELLLDSLMNAIKGVVKVCSTFKKAWQEMFDPITSEQIYSVIESINTFSQHLIMGDETAEKLKRTFKGLLAIVDIVTTIMGGGLRITIHALNAVLGMFNMDILDATASVSDMIVQFRDWLKSTFDITKALEYIVPPIMDAVRAFMDWVNLILTSDDPIKVILDGLKSGFSTAFDGIKQVVSEAMQFVSDKLSKIEFLKPFIDQVKAYGKRLFDGLSDGFQNGISSFYETIKNVFGMIVSYLKGVDWSTAFAGFLMGGMLATVNKFIDTFSGIGKMCDSIGDMLDDIGKTVKAHAFEARARGILKLAIAVGVLAASIYVLAKLDSDELQRGLIVLTAMVGLLIILSFVTSKIGTAVDSLGKTGSILMLAGSLLIIAGALKMLSDIDSDGIINATNGIIVALGAMVGLMGICKLLAKGAVSFTTVGSMLLKMSVAILLMILAVKTASSLDKGQVKRGIAVVGMIEMLFLAVVAASKVAGPHGAVAGKMFGRMARAMGIMVLVIKIASMLDRSEVKRGMEVVAQVELLFLAAMAVSKLAGANAAKAGSMFMGMAIAFVIMGYAIKNAAGINPADVDSAIKTFAKIGVLFGALIFVSRFAGQNATKAGALLIGMSTAMLVLTASMAVLSHINADGLENATNAISQLMAMMSLLIFASGKSGKATGSLTGMAIAISVLCGALIALAFVDEEKLHNAILAVIAVIGFMKVIENVKLSTVIGVLASFAVFILAIGLIIRMMSDLDPDDALKNAKALGAVLIGMAAALFAASKVEIIDYKTVGTLLTTMVGIVGIMSLLVLVLAQMQAMDVRANMNNVYALCILLGAISIVAVALSKLSTGLTWKDVGTSMAVIYGLAGVMAILGLVLAEMSALNVTDCIRNATALCMLLGAIAIAMIPMGIIGRFGPTILWGALAMAALSGVMAILGLVLAEMSALNVRNGIENATALSILIGAISIAIIPMGIIGRFGPTIMAGALGMTALAGVMAILGLVLAEMSALNVRNGIENATALSILIGALAIAVIPMGLIGRLGPTILWGALGMAALAGVVAILGLVLAEMTALNIQNGIENATALGILVLALSVAMIPLGLIGTLGPSILIGCAALALIAAVLIGAIKAFQAWIAPGLPEMATNLSDFMTNLQPFIDGASKINDDAVQGCKNISEMLLALSGASITDGIMSFLSGGGNWTDGIGDTLSAFAEAMVTFSNKLTEGNFNPEAVNAAANAGQMIAALQESLPNSGGAISEKISSLVGKKDMAGFGTELEAFGESMAKFSDKVKDVKPEAVEAAANAGRIMSEMADTIPNSGGVLADFLGDNTMDVFGTQLVSFGESLAAFSKTITGENAIDASAVEAAAKAGAALAEMANEIPNEGGWLAKIVGDNQIDTFGDKLPLFGEALAGFSQKVDGINPSAVTSAAEAGKSLAEMAATIPNEGGWISKIVGENNLDTFATNIQKLGGGMKSFSDEASGINLEAVSGAPTAINSIKDVIDKLPSKDSMKGKIGEKDIQNLDSIVQSIVILSNAADQVNNLDTSKIPGAIEDLKALMSTMSNMSGKDFSGISAFSNALDELGSISVDKFANAFKNSSSKVSNAAKSMLDTVLSKIKGEESKFKTSGSSLVNCLATGMMGVSIKVAMAITMVLNSAKSAITNKYQSFYTAGSYLMDGLASGIRASAYKAATAAANAMISAVSAAKEAAGIHSPSRVFYEMGEFTIAGFVNALTDLGGKVYDSGYGMAENARVGFSNAIARITDSFSEDNLAQPTIRPVLDLSSVESGAGSINRMFNMSPSVGLLANVGAIDSMMSNRQNGNGSDGVISAIDKLRKEIGNVGGTTNYINGITYDDGSNVSDAVATLIRAARIERRR